MKKIVLLGLCFAMLTACKKEEKQDLPKMTENQPLAPVSDTMMENAVIYEANIRNYSPEGTFDAFTKDIPELKKTGRKSNMADADLPYLHEEQEND